MRSDLAAPNAAIDHPATPPSIAGGADTGGRLSPRTAAVIAGVGYVLLFALALFANFFVRQGLIVSGDPEATAANIIESEGLFRLGMVSFLIIFLLDVVVAWALYLVFRTVDRDLSLVAAWFRLVYTVLLGVAVVFLFQALQLVDSDEAQAMVALDTFNSTWLIGLAGFGVHLIVLGYLLVTSRYGPAALGAVLIAAGSAYLVDTGAHTILSDYRDYETLFTVIVAGPAVVAEGWFGLWLLLRAGRAPVRSLAYDPNTGSDRVRTGRRPTHGEEDLERRPAGHSHGERHDGR